MARRLLRYLLPHRWLMGGAITAMIAGSLVDLAGPWPLKLIVDNVLAEQPLLGRELDGDLKWVLLALASAGFLLLAALRGGFAFLRTRWLTEASQEASVDMRADLYSQVQRFSLRYHDRSRTGDMVTRITTDVDKLQDAFATGLTLFSVDMLTVFGIVVVMLIVDWRFALVTLSVLPPLFFLFVQFRSRVKTASRDVRASEGSIASLAQEVLSSIRVVKAFSQEDREQERFGHQTRAKAEASVRVATLEGLFSLLVEVATALGVAIVLGYGGWRTISGEITLGEMLVFIQYLNIVYTPLRRLSRLTTVVQKAAASGERIYELFEVAPEVPEAEYPVFLGPLQGRLRFEDVTFGYVPNQPVLSNVMLEIAPGERVALVGPTGAGKTTLVSLIPRFYDPVAGSVFLDGHDLRELRLRSLREQISIVLQESILFSGSVRDNIAYGRPEASDEEVEAAAMAAHAHEFIVELPEGYDSPVGERGVTLSGGQRQRIAIARALLRDSPILILDEPTSSVDKQSEATIMDALRTLVQGRTVIIIAHRSSTTELAERLVVLREGRIVESGTVEELKSNGSFYKRLFVT